MLTIIDGKHWRCVLSIEILRFRKKHTWLNARKQDVTATEVSALFGIGRMSLYKLWMTKKTGIIEEVPDNERMKWGIRLESAIGNGITEDLSHELGIPIMGHSAKRYYRDTELKAGASPDWILTTEDGEQMPLEIKTVDKHMFKYDWSDQATGELMAPLRIELQLQQQMMLMGLKRGYIGALVGGNQVHVLPRTINYDLVEAIKKKITNFWASIEANEPPPIDYGVDYDLIMDMARESDRGEPISASLRVGELVTEYDRLKAVADETEKQIKAIRGEIMHEVGDHALVHGDGWRLDTKLIGGSDGKTITQDMVGTVTGVRKPYRQFKIFKD